MTLPCPKNAFKGKATHPRTKPTIREQIDCGGEKFIVGVEQKKGAVTAFFQPVGITLHELLDLRLGEGKTVEPDAKTAKHFLKGAVSVVGGPATSQFQCPKLESIYLNPSLAPARVSWQSAAP